MLARPSGPTAMARYLLNTVLHVAVRALLMSVGLIVALLSVKRHDIEEVVFWFRTLKSLLLNNQFSNIM